MTENPVDPAHDDHGDDPDDEPEEATQDTEPIPLVDNAPEPEASGEEHSDPPPGDDGM